MGEVGVDDDTFGTDRPPERAVDLGKVVDQVAVEVAERRAPGVDVGEDTNPRPQRLDEGIVDRGGSGLAKTLGSPVEGGRAGGSFGVGVGVGVGGGHGRIVHPAAIRPDSTDGSTPMIGR